MEKLLKILGPAYPDVFQAMASKWKKKPLEAIEVTERQQVKQICYGILYGIGVKALSEQLENYRKQLVGLEETKTKMNEKLMLFGQSQNGLPS